MKQFGMNQGTKDSHFSGLKFSAKNLSCLSSDLPGLLQALKALPLSNLPPPAGGLSIFFHVCTGDSHDLPAYILKSIISRIKKTVP
jgi:hypothetical protein